MEQVEDSKKIYAGDSPVNPYMADSQWHIIHGNSAALGSTLWAGPKNGPVVLDPKYITYQHGGQHTSLVPVFSGPYPNGSRVMWNGAVDRVMKQDARTGKLIDEYFFPEVRTRSAEEADEIIEVMDRYSITPERDLRMLVEKVKQYERGFDSGRLTSFYHFVDRDNDFYTFSMPRTVGVFGDEEPGNPRSKIVLKREWTVPQEVSKAIIYSANMTYDGWVVLVTTDGVIFAVSRDFSTYHWIRLAGSQDIGRDLMDAFVRDGIVVDPDGGIYATGGAYVYRIQWTGDRLSADPADGAWQVEITSHEGGYGSGTTPTVMGFAEGADKLLILADGNKVANMLALWRDKIPEDWEGLPDQPRRIAGKVPISFGHKLETLELENSPNVWGYGIFAVPAYTFAPLPENIGRMGASTLGAILQNDPEYHITGAEKFEWDPIKRELRSAWTNPDIVLSNAIPIVSAGSGLAYDIGFRNGKWTLEALDWETGKSVFHTAVGESHRYNPYWSPVTIAPDGNVFYNGMYGTIHLSMGGKNND